MTLSLPRDLLTRAKQIAVAHDTSLSALLAGLIEEVVAQEDRYASARERAIERLAHPLDLGTHGRAPWTREDLHRRA